MARYLRSIFLVGLLVAAFAAAEASRQVEAGGLDTLWVDSDGDCAGNSAFTTIQEAVDNANPGATIFVCPGTYDESVDLDQMGSACCATQTGDITLTTVDENGNPTPGTATVNGGAGSAFEASSAFTGDITLDGFIVTSQDDGIDFGSAPANLIDGSVVVRNVVANGNGENGIEINVTLDITVENSTANGNTDNGLELFSSDVLCTVIVTNVTANGNDIDGISQIGNSIQGKGANFIGTNLTTNENGDDGTDLGDSDEVNPEFVGDVTIDGLTSLNNEGDGLDVVSGGFTDVQNSFISGNGADSPSQHGIELFRVNGGASINQSCIFDNVDAGLRLQDNELVNAENNWWGDPSGPTHPENPGGSGDEVEDADNGGSGDVDFEPFATQPLPPCAEQDGGGDGVGNQVPVPELDPDIIFAPVEEPTVVEATPAAEEPEGEGPRVGTGDSGIGEAQQVPAWRVALLALGSAAVVLVGWRLYRRTG